MAKAAHWLDTDAEVRKCGEQTGLDTLVVHTVNDECQTSARVVCVCVRRELARRRDCVGMPFPEEKLRRESGLGICVGPVVCVCAGKPEGC